MNQPIHTLSPEEIRKLPPIVRLKTIMQLLRSEKGCPWDKEQTHESIADCVVEEAHELVEAILSGDSSHMVEELGDVLLQVVFHAQIAQEKGLFDLDTVAETISEKLLVRHPHVFGESVVKDSKEVKELWDKIKLTEQGKSDRGIFGGIASGLPALQKAEKIQKKAGKQGFDWDHWEGALEKVSEETQELKTALESKDNQSIEEELGDLLFSVVNVSRKIGVSPTVALEKANQKFMKRYLAMESLKKLQGVELSSSLTPEQWETLWQQAKKL